MAINLNDVDISNLELILSRVSGLMSDISTKMMQTDTAVSNVNNEINTVKASVAGLLTQEPTAEDVTVLLANGIILQKTRTQTITVNTSANSNVTFDFPNKLLGLISFGISDNHVRSWSVTTGTNSASSAMTCDGSYTVNVTYVAIGY